MTDREIWDEACRPKWETQEEPKAHRIAEAEYYGSLRRIDDSNMPFPELWGFHAGWDACIEWLKENSDATC